MSDAAPYVVTQPETDRSRFYVHDSNTGKNVRGPYYTEADADTVASTLNLGWSLLTEERQP